MSKCGVISGPYFPVFGLSTGKYGPEITSHVDTFHAVPQSSKNEFWGKSTVANINIFLSHISKDPLLIEFDVHRKYT